MNESSGKEHLRDIDVRRNVGIDRNPLDEIKAIQALLADVYKNAGDGRTLFRELVQNADDARARRLTFTVLERGWPDAQNSLLRGPALLVANDGPFPGRDRDGMHRAIGGSKEDDVTKIGTFGIGLKSAFHICEAFLYIGAARSKWLAGVLNPWAGTGEEGQADPLHPDWDEIGERDVKRLRIVMTELLGETDDGLLLWIPVRLDRHRDRGADDRRYGLGDHCPESQELCSWFGCPTPAALLLAQCGHLQALETKRAERPERLDGSEQLMLVARQAGRGWLGRYQDDNRQITRRAFDGTIAVEGTIASEASTSKWFAVGIESLGGQGLRDLRAHPNWPQSSQWRSGRHATVPRKALAHAAVTVLWPVDWDANRLGTRLRWAAFLPLDDHPAPNSSAIVESDGPSPAWEIILHGYFWPSQDRRSIPGVTDKSGDAAIDGDMRSRWNRTLCEDLLLPLLPSALARAVNRVDGCAAQELLERVVQSEVVKSRIRCVTQEHWLLPEVTKDGVQWRAVKADASPVLAIPDWSQAPETARTRFLASCAQYTGDVRFIDDGSPRLAGELDDWTVDRCEGLLNSIPVDAFASRRSLEWIEAVARHVLGPDARVEDTRAAFVRWLARRIAGGALAPTIRRSTSREVRDELRAAWRGLCAAIPTAWFVETPVDTVQAVVELTKRDGVIGEGLFLLPVGRGSGDSRPTLNLDGKRLDCALAALGQLLKAGGESERSRHSRLLLAETLLSIRPDGPMDDYLRGLPFLRAIRLPDDKEEAWSIADLHGHIEKHRVFARPASQDLTTDPKRAATELAAALGEAVWLVNGNAVESAADVPIPEREALAGAVLQAETFAKAASRSPLLHRLTSSVSVEPDVRLAVRVLLAGRGGDVVGRRTELFWAGDRRRRALLILLRLLGQSWRAVDGQLVGSLSQDILEHLSVSQADLNALHGLLDECLSGRVDWTVLGDEEAQHLLESLHSADLEGQLRWRRMPLHRGVDGDRGACDDRARRSTRGPGDELPPDLLAGVRLLVPDSVVAHLYKDVPELDRDGVLQLMLTRSRPWRFAESIVQHLRPAGGPPRLPRDEELRGLLRDSRWLPDRAGDGIAPEAVIIAPNEVLDSVRDLALCDAFGDKRLPDSVDPQIWAMAEPVVREVLGRMARRRQVARLADALVSGRVAKVDGGAWLVMSEPRLVDEWLISAALKTTLVGSHRGWKLLHVVNQVLGDGNDHLLVSLAKSLCGPVPPKRQIEMLRLIADSRPAKDSPGGSVFKRLLDCFAAANGFFEDVLPKLNLPTQDGNWHPSREVARTEIGVARQHRLVSELRPILRLDDDDWLPSARPDGDYRSGVGTDPLRSYFEPWHNQLRHGAVGAFLSLLGRGWRGEIAKLTREWVGEDINIKDMRSPLVDPNDQDPFAHLTVWISPRFASGNRIRAVNIVGERVEMEAEVDADTLFAVKPNWHPPHDWGKNPRGPYWEIVLRDVDPQTHTSHQLMNLLGGTVERWATRHLKLDRERVKAWWSQWGKSPQAELRLVLASIKAQLPLTLRQLDVRELGPLWDALKAAERAQRQREQAPATDTSKADRERESLDHLAKLIDRPDYQEFLSRRVNELMRRYGYREDSVLLELAQNADDALAQAAEINRGTVPSSTRRFLVRVHENGGAPTVDVMHWGRPINDHGGAAFPAGRDLEWDQDLYFMMLMNLSGKPGEAPGKASLSSTTGRFGLGFKSVHLLSSSPSVVSGFIAFSIAGGLLPKEQSIPADAESWVREGRRATLVRLPLRRNVDASKLLDRFAYARALLPVFARQVREVVVERGPYRGVHVFDGKQMEGASAWSIGAETELPDHAGRWRILRFRPSDAGRKGMGTAALALGLRDGIPTAFAQDLPFLWNVTPTSERWACGYAVNGPFKLDPGRTHVSLDDDTTCHVVRSLGDELGRGLIELHDALTSASSAAHFPVRGVDGHRFLSSMWEVLASGLGNADTLRRAFLRDLHGNDRGISAWMAARPVVPTRLPAPFPPLLPPLSSGAKWEVAADGLDDPDLCAALAEIDDEDFRPLVSDRRIVSYETNQRLEPLCALAEPDGDPSRPSALRLPDLLAELAEKWDYFLTPARLHALRPLSEAAVWDSVSNDPYKFTWRTRLRARSADGSEQPLRRLLLQEVSALRDGTDGDLDDELLRSAFAPTIRILDPAYIGCPEDWLLFRWLRLQHRVDAAEIADWYRDVEEDLRPAALRYLLDGRLRDSVLPLLIPPEARPSWLQDFHDVRLMLQRICEERWRRRGLLVALFPEQLPGPGPSPRPPRVNFFHQLTEWWDDATVRSEVIAAYERRAWPEWLRRNGGISSRLRSGSEDHWLALLVLGVCRRLGRTQRYQHRGFLDFVRQRGWWSVLKAPGNERAWMQMLRDWQDRESVELPYAQWMSLFPAIYQLSRYRKTYVRLLKLAGQPSVTEWDITHWLKSRVNPALTGAGTQFDAPPAPLGMGLHWVLRELVRLDVVDGEHLYADCWVPSEQMIGFLHRFGLDRPDDRMSNPPKARAIFDFLASELDTAAPNLHRAFDIPIRHVDSSSDLRRRFGLEQ